MQPDKPYHNPIARFFSYLKASITGEQKDFTTGSIRKAIFMLSVPMILEMVMESLFAVVDVFFVSKIGTDAVATVGLTESIMAIIYGVGIGLSVATAAMVARRTGEKKPEEAAEAAVQGIAIGVIISIILGVSGVVFAKDILRIMGGSETLIEEGFRYTQIMLGGNIVIMFLFINNAIFRGAGDASIAMKSLWLANILNIILGPVFIFGFGPIPGFGVEGAAIATTIGRGSGVIFQFYILFSSRSAIKINKENFKLRPELMGKIFNISLGGMGQFLIGSASWIFLVRIISIFGSDALAGYTIALRVIVFTILPSWGLANAAATLVGQNLGAGQPDRAEKSVWKAAFYNMLFLTAISIIFFILAEDIIGLFSTEQKVLDYGVMGLKYICAGYIFFAYGMVITQSFNGAGDTRTPTVISIVTFWLLETPLAYLLAVPLGFGPSGVFISILIAFTVSAIISILVFRKGKWKMVRI